LENVKKYYKPYTKSNNSREKSYFLEREVKEIYVVMVVGEADFEIPIVIGEKEDI